MRKVLQLDARDNVLIALSDLKQGDVVEFNGSTYPLLSRVPAKHKFATEDLPVGTSIVMYGVLVGKVVRRVQRGEALTLENVRHEALPFHDKAAEFRWKAPEAAGWEQKRFLGYRRSDGQVGTRNYWIVVPLVFCENRNILNLKQAFEEELGFAPEQNYRRQVAELAQLYREGKTELIRTHTTQQNGRGSESRKLFPQMDGIRFLLHEGGCGGTREDSDNLCGLIAGYIHHPNVAGATVLSLGRSSAAIRSWRSRWSFWSSRKAGRKAA
jgi:altronate hydrolase